MRFLPPRHSGPDPLLHKAPTSPDHPLARGPPIGIPRTARALPRRQGPAHDPGPLPRRPRRGRRAVRGARPLRLDLPGGGIRRPHPGAPRNAQPADQEGADDAPALPRPLARREPRLGGAGAAAAPPDRPRRASPAACVIVGVDDHLEVWSPERWGEHDAEIDAQADEIAESLGAAEAGARMRRGDGALKRWSH